MRITSSAFADGETIPRRFTCDGENRSPPLAWSGLPENTRSLTLICDDPDAPAGTWFHWAVYDMPPTLQGLREGIPRRDPSGIRQAVNDSRETGYNGPCPPRGHGPHRYRFRLMALSVEKLDDLGDSGCRDVERAAKEHLIAETVLTGIYARP